MTIIDHLKMEENIYFECVAQAKQEMCQIKSINHTDKMRREGPMSYTIGLSFITITTLLSPRLFNTFTAPMLIHKCGRKLISGLKGSAGERRGFYV